MKRCLVSYKDSLDISHGVEVEADSLFEAVGLAIARFNKDPNLEYHPASFVEYTIEPREVYTSHSVRRKQFDEWMNRSGKSPKEAAAKARVKEAMDTR